jgi:hypothetical protein
MATMLIVAILILVVLAVIAGLGFLWMREMWKVMELFESFIGLANERQIMTLDAMTTLHKTVMKEMLENVIVLMKGMADRHNEQLNAITIAVDKVHTTALESVTASHGVAAAAIVQATADFGKAAQEWHEATGSLKQAADDLQSASTSHDSSATHLHASSEQVNTMLKNSNLEAIATHLQAIKNFMVPRG